MIVLKDYGFVRVAKFIEKPEDKRLIGGIVSRQILKKTIQKLLEQRHIIDFGLAEERVDPSPKLQVIFS